MEWVKICFGTEKTEVGAVREYYLTPDRMAQQNTAVKMNDNQTYKYWKDLIKSQADPIGNWGEVPQEAQKEMKTMFQKIGIYTDGDNLFKTLMNTETWEQFARRFDSVTFSHTVQVVKSYTLDYEDFCRMKQVRKLSPQERDEVWATLLEQTDQQVELDDDEEEEDVDMEYFEHAVKDQVADAMENWGEIRRHEEEEVRLEKERREKEKQEKIARLRAELAELEKA